VRERYRGLDWDVVWFVVAWAWVQVRVWHCEVSSDVCADPVCDVLLVHRVLIDLVLARTWHIQVLSASLSLHTEAELRNLALSLVRLGWVSEIEVTRDSIVAWSRSSRVLVVNLGSRLIRKVDTFTSARAEVSALLLVPLLLSDLLLLFTDHLELFLANLLWAGRWIFLLPAHLTSNVFTNLEAHYLVHVVSLVLAWTWLIARPIYLLSGPEKHLLRGSSLVRCVNVWVILTWADLQAVPFSPLIHVLFRNVDDVWEPIACSFVRLKSIIRHRNHRLAVLGWRRVMLRQVRKPSLAIAECGVLSASLTAL
jgi:hypothetical protein